MTKNISYIVILLLLIKFHSIAQKPAKIIVGPNVMVTTEHQQDGTNYELHVTAHPTNPKILLGTGILDRVQDPRGGQETRTYYSNDGGNTWKTTLYSEAANQDLGDPVVAFGRTGTGYFVALGDKEEKQQTLFYRSEDGGITWEKPLYLSYIDHEQIVVDHNTRSSYYAGNIYMAGLYRPCSSGIMPSGAADFHIGVLRSNDDGRTWKLTDVANNHDMYMLNKLGFNSSPSPVVFTNGELLVPFQSWESTKKQPSEEEIIKSIKEKGSYESQQYWFVNSKDGGNTFLPPQKLLTENGGEIKGASVPIYAVDNSNGPFKDRIYVVWADREYSPSWQISQAGDPDWKAQLFISYSSNYGKTWSVPKKISAGPALVGQEFMPTIAVNNDGTLAVNWYYTKGLEKGNGLNNKTLIVDQYITASIDGAQTFLPKERLSSKSTDVGMLMSNVMGVSKLRYGAALQSSMNNYRDYFGMAAASDGTFHPFWLDGRTGSHQIWTASIQVDRNIIEKPKPALVDSNVSKQIEVVIEPLRQFPDMVELPIRIKNKSNKTIYGPITVEVTEMTGWQGGWAPLKDGPLLNGDNNKNGGVGTTFSYSSALGTSGSLPPDAISEAVVWKLKKPKNAVDFPRFLFKIMARVEK